MNNYIQMLDEVSDMNADVISAIDYCRSLAKEERITAGTVNEMCEAFPNRFSPINSPYKACYDRAGAYDQIADMLVELKARRIQDRWIPTSERLPEAQENPLTRDFEEVWCTTIWGDVRAYKFGKQIGDDTAHFWGYGDIMDQYVVAWQYKPEPYKESEAEDE